MWTWLFAWLIIDKAVLDGAESQRVLCKCAHFQECKKCCFIDEGLGRFCKIRGTRLVWLTFMRTWKRWNAARFTPDQNYTALNGVLYCCVPFQFTPLWLDNKIEFILTCYLNASAHSFYWHDRALQMRFQASLMQFSQSVIYLWRRGSERVCFVKF